MTFQKYVRPRVRSTVGLPHSQRESAHRRQSSTGMATLVYTDGNTSYSRPSSLLARSIPLKWILYRRAQHCPLYASTRLPQSPARTNLSHPQGCTHDTRAARLSQLESSNARSTIALIQVLGKTTLGFISKLTTREIGIRAANGMIIRPIS